MKNKFIILTLCFTIIFSNINLSNYKSYANNYEPLVVDGGVITAPMVATIATLAVASGIVLSSDDDIYDMAYTFYLRHKDNWEYVQETFNACVSIAKDGIVSVGSDFLNLVKDCFDNLVNNFGNESSLTLNNGLWYLGKLQYNQDFNKRAYEMGYKKVIDNTDFSVGVFDFKFDKVQNGYSSYKTYVNGNYFYTFSFLVEGKEYSFATCQSSNNAAHRLITYTTFDGSYYNTNTSSNYATVYSNAIDIPYVPGSYSPGGVLDKDNLGIYVPGNASDLVGSLPSDVVLGGNPSYEYGGDITLPGVENPSIDSTLSGTFNPSLDTDVPGVDSPSIPNDSIWSSIKDFVISLVVPSDTFWTDTFNGFRDNFSKNFPMLDMSKFDSLVVGGKPFPNLYAYGSKIVDGDVINSIVDWLRPIVAGFIMICLMFFNYRKIYKLIRNTEPFGGIAQGSSDFRTGLSAPPINNGLDSNPMGSLRDTLFDMRNEILRRENEK